jgi:hypothetical protein
MEAIRFRFSPEKARAALHWMASEQDNIDLHAAMKACYFADKAHLNAHGRPVFGATYRAMKFGPVPLEIYEMAKGEAIWMAELGVDRLPWELRGYRLKLVGNEEPDLSALSASDLEELRKGFNWSRHLDFNSRTAITHGKDWQKASLGIMRYEDMLDDGADKPEIISYLRENARFMRL